tara:strand:+ start:16 stop:555 length:540 start_codon:yes stop_codon:yes gene_type:complete
MKKIRLNKKKGILFWITGLSGSGKSLIAKKIKPQIVKKYGPSILVSGDNMRKIFNFNKYTRDARLSNAINFSKFSEFITNQKVNVIFNNIGMFHKPRNRNKLKIENYVEIYIKAELNQIIKAGKKKIYKQYSKNIVGIDIVPELPRSPDIIINNDFKKSINQLSMDLLKKINKLLKGRK